MNSRDRDELLRMLSDRISREFDVRHISSPDEFHAVDVWCALDGLPMFLLQLVPDAAGVSLKWWISEPPMTDLPIHSRYLGGLDLVATSEVIGSVARALAESRVAAREYIAAVHDSLSDTSVDWPALLERAISNENFVTATILQRSEFDGGPEIAQVPDVVGAALRLAAVQEIAGLASIAPEVVTPDLALRGRLRAGALELTRRIEARASSRRN